jgi:hypothetical protein
MLSATAMPPAAISIGCTWRRTVCSISASVSARAGATAESMTEAANASVITRAVIRIACLPSPCAAALRHHGAFTRAAIL